jgi:glycosyltransferase involved in cell wall biosynthesis
MPKINVLFISDNFVPETNAAATRVYERAQYWNEWDINCQVITSFPNRYKGKNHPGYSDRFFKKEIIGGISTVRVKTFISASPSFFLRALHQLSFTINAFFAGLFKRHIDVIIVTTPQFFCTLTGLLLSKLKRVPYIIEIADIWSDSIKGTLLTESFLYRLLRGFETWMLNQSDSLIVLTKGFKDEIIKRGISERKISVSRNGVNEISLPDEKLVQKYREELGLKEKKVLGYMGAHGAAQGLDNLIESAKILEFSNPEIIFVFIGDGDEKKELMRLSNPLRI